MKKSFNVSKKLLTPQNLYRLVLAVLGFSLFPGIIFLISKILFETQTAISDSYSKFYGSLLNFGTDGLISWGIGCTPYMVYDIYFLIRSYRTQKGDTDK